MPRSRTSLEQFGRITVTGEVVTPDGRWIAVPAGVKPDRWVARTRYRDADGVLRNVRRFDATRAKAEIKLKAALSVRETPAGTGGLMRPEMPVREAGAVWLEQVRRSKLSENTKQQYADSFARYVEDSAISSLTLRELKVGPLMVFFQHIADTRGDGAAKTTKSVVSNILSLAVKLGAIEHNATRDTGTAHAVTPKVTARDTERALTRDERAHFLTVADMLPAAREADVSDIANWMAGTGVRISEALGQRWEDIDFDSGRVVVRGTKTDASVRVLKMPKWLRKRMTKRARSHGALGLEGERTARLGQLVFPSPGISDTTKMRDRRNVSRVMREIFDAADLPWATAHSLRRTVAHLIDEAGGGIALAANQLGHANAAMTARVYLNRKADTSAAAKLL